MNRMVTGIAFCLGFFLLLSGGVYNVFADHDDHDNRERNEKREKRHSEQDDERDVAVVTNSIYAETCGACHFAYQPGLLPSGSWDKILNSLSDHFGETVEIDPESAKTVTKYLKANSADHSSAELSREIMESLDGGTPIRITQVPCIQKEHHEIPSNVFERKSIGSFSNCAACHKNAEKGIYDDDDVNIPK
jgi:mono/diheme cytochrome c family protein